MIDDNMPHTPEYAFPNAPNSNGVGLTIRDYFAITVLPALMKQYPHNDDAAIEAYKVADEMLEARKKT